MSQRADIAEINTRSIQTILSENTGKSIEDIENAMNVETFYEGEEQKTFGLVDQIVNTSKQPIEVEDKYELMNLYKKDNNNQKSIKMDKVLNKLGATTEDGALLKIAEVENAHKLEVENLDKEKQELQSKIEELENKIALDTKAAVEAIVNKAIEDGKCAEDSKDSMLEIGNSLGIDQLNKVFAAVKIPHVDIVNSVGGSGKKGEEGKDDEKDWEWYEKNDPAGLMEMENKNPELYNKLLKEDAKKYEE